MKILREDVWKRRGISLLWGAQGLSAICNPEQVVSLRQFFSMTNSWPSDTIHTTQRVIRSER
jgi:hypothetical protein